IRCASPGSKAHGLQVADRAVDPFLQDQVGAIDIGFVPVIAISPAQHCSYIVTVEATHGATEEYLGVSNLRAKHGAIAAPASVVKLAGIIFNGEDAGIGSIAAPRLTIGSLAPAILVSAPESVLRQGGSRRRCGSRRRGIRWRWGGGWRICRGICR